jgi:hypothetical protein
MQLLCFLIGTNYEPVLLHAVYKLVSYIVYHAVDSNLMKCTTTENITLRSKENVQITTNLKLSITEN